MSGRLELRSPLLAFNLNSGPKEWAACVGERICFTIRKSFEHATEVQAASVYEAPCRAWSKFRSDDGTEEESFKASEFIAEVEQDPRVFHVGSDKLLWWLDRGRAVAQP